MTAPTYIDVDALQTPHASPLSDAEGFADEPDYLLPYTGPICTGCGFPCELRTEDVGIGPYEYQGAPGVDVRQAVVSECCGESVEEER